MPTPTGDAVTLREPLIPGSREAAAQQPSVGARRSPRARRVAQRRQVRNPWAWWTDPNVLRILLLFNNVLTYSLPWLRYAFDADLFTCKVAVVRILGF